LRADGAEVVVSDIDPAKREVAAALELEWIDPLHAPTTDTDLLVPAALGGLLTTASVADLRCRAVVGPANNQLADSTVAELLAQRGILWAPDFLVNAGGVVYGFEMEFGSRDQEAAMTAVRAIADTLRDVFARAVHEGITPLAAAAAVAGRRVAAAR